MLSVVGLSMNCEVPFPELLFEAELITVRLSGIVNALRLQVLEIVTQGRSLVRVRVMLQTNDELPLSEYTTVESLLEQMR